MMNQFNMIHLIHLLNLSTRKMNIYIYIWHICIRVTKCCICIASGGWVEQHNSNSNSKNNVPIKNKKNHLCLLDAVQVSEHRYRLRGFSSRRSIRLCGERGSDDQTRQDTDRTG